MKLVDFTLTRLVVVLVAFSFLSVGTENYVSAQDDSDLNWPQWRGPNRDDLSKETGLLKKWPDEGPKKLWSSDEGGMGYAGFAVVDDRVFTLGASDDGEFAICLDVNDGSVVWKTRFDGLFKNAWGDGPRNTPTVDGDMVYVMSANGELACLKTSDGSKVWNVSMADNFGGKAPYWGYSESPLVDGDKVVVTPGGGDGAMVALNKMNGDTIWQSRLFTDASQYSSIVPAEIGGKKQYVQLVMSAVVGIDAENGALLWRQKWNGKTAVIPTPIVDGNKVYVASGYNVGSMQFEVGDDFETTVNWSNRVMKNHHGGVIKLGDHYFGYSDKVGWVCQNQNDGEIAWRNKQDAGKGAIAYADGCFYLLTERKGEVLLIDASSSEWNELSRFTLEPQSENRASRGMIWVHPVISNGKMYLRDQEMISCFDIKE